VGALFFYIMNKLGYDLKFISKIKRDGSGTETLTKEEELLNNSEKFNLTRLSISEGTYIASGFNSFVVKIKDE